MKMSDEFKKAFSFTNWTFLVQIETKTPSAYSKLVRYDGFDYSWTF